MQYFIAYNMNKIQLFVNDSRILWFQLFLLKNEINMNFDFPDLTKTIVAVSSPTGKGRRAIVRFSGKESSKFGEIFAGNEFTEKLITKEKSAIITSLNHLDWRNIPVMILWMPAPKSYTREDVLELHLPASKSHPDKTPARGQWLIHPS